MGITLSFYIDGQLVENPEGWEDTGVKFDFDPSSATSNVSYPAEYTFFGTAYNLLYARHESANYAQLVECRVHSNDQSAPLLTGFIFLSDCTFNEVRRTVNVKIRDNGFSSRIQNNKSTEVLINTPETKNGQVMTPTPSYGVVPFDVRDGSFITDLVGCYRVSDTFAALTTWMSDGLIDFYSDYFTNGQGKLYYLTTGINIRQRSPNGVVVDPPNTSFFKLFEIWRKLKNLAMGFDIAIDGRPRVRIEPLQYFRSSANVFTLEDMAEVELSFMFDLLFAQVRVGTEITRPNQCDSATQICGASVNINYFGCDLENYPLTGEANVDRTLDLSVSGGFRYDSNTIQDVAVWGNDALDKEIFILEVDDAFACVDTDPLGVNEHWYNGTLMNDQTIAVYQNWLFGTLGLYSLASNKGLFYADNFISAVLLPDQTPTYTDYIVDPLNVVFNPDSWWSNVTNRFTPTEDGVFEFECMTPIISFGSSPIGVTVLTQLNVDHYDSGGTLIFRYSGPVEFYITGDPSEQYTYTTPPIAMDATDYCIFTLSYAQSLPTGVSQSEIMYGVVSFGPTVTAGYFRLISSRTATQNIQVNTGQDVTLCVRSFEFPLTKANMQAFLSDTTKGINLQFEGMVKNTWAKSIEHNFVTGKTTFELLSKK